MSIRELEHHKPPLHESMYEAFISCCASQADQPSQPHSCLGFNDILNDRSWHTVNPAKGADGKSFLQPPRQKLSSTQG